MSLSIFLTIYILFLIVYGALLGFAVYKVFLFAKNRDLKGYSRRITLIFLIIVLSIVFISFLLIPRYHWDDNLSFYCKKISRSCSCETDDKKREACLEQEKKNLETEKKDQTTKINQEKNNSEVSQDKTGFDKIRPRGFLFIN